MLKSKKKVLSVASVGILCSTDSLLSNYFKSLASSHLTGSCFGGMAVLGKLDKIPGGKVFLGL